MRPHHLLELEGEAELLREMFEADVDSETAVALAGVQVRTFGFQKYWIRSLRSVDRHASWHKRHLEVCMVLYHYDGWSEPARRAAASLWATIGAARNDHALVLPSDFFQQSPAEQLGHFAAARPRALG